MATVLHDKDCEDHGLDFTHRVITTRGGNHFIICGTCEHWIDSSHYECSCYAGCHVGARAEESVMQLTVSKGSKPRK